MIAFHFPPLKGSSGIERTLGFCRHLGSYGWDPLVLTASTKAYPGTSPERTDAIPGGVRVIRAFARDTARSLSIGGRYPGWTALPDRWISWVLGAVPAGLKAIRDAKPRVIWSTYPLATAHIVGWALHRLTGLPWIADFRDPMVEHDHRTGTVYPDQAPLRNARLWVERRCAARATRAVFCTEGARAIFADRYPRAAARTAVIANGFDEDAFVAAQSGCAVGQAAQGGPVTLVHSGILYPTSDRDPRPFLEAVARVLTEAPQWRSRLRVILRATGFDGEYAPAIRDLGIGDCVSLASSIPYHDALREMMTATGLLVFQGYTSNPAIPAKVYEYLRAGRPVLGMVDAEGETAALLRNEHAAVLVDITDVAAIARALEGFLRSLDGATAETIEHHRAALYERKLRARELAQLLDEVACHEGACRSEAVKA